MLSAQVFFDHAVCKCVSSQKKGHKEEILCVAHCPPSLLATGSCDGEVIVWDVVSGRMQCRFTSPPPDEQQHTDGDDGPSKVSNRSFACCAISSFTLIFSLLIVDEQESTQVSRAPYS